MHLESRTPKHLKVLARRFTRTATRTGCRNPGSRRLWDFAKPLMTITFDMIIFWRVCSVIIDWKLLVPHIVSATTFQHLKTILNNLPFQKFVQVLMHSRDITLLYCYLTLLKDFGDWYKQIK